MRKEQVIITPVRITRASQNKHFQVKLPKTAKKIIGIELGGFWLGPVGDAGVIFIGGPSPRLETPVFHAGLETPDSGTVFGSGVGKDGGSRLQFFKRNTLIGEMKLQSCEEANIFYAGHLQMDNNLAQGDFTQNAFWKPQPFTHETKSFEEKIIVDADSTIINGLYRDRLGENLSTKTRINYLVNLYVWIEVETEQPKNK